MNVFDIISQKGEKKLTFYQNLPLNLEIALHSIYYVRDFLNIANDAFLKIEIMLETENIEIKIFVPPSNYTTFQSLKSVLYVEAKKIIDNNIRKYVLDLINRMKLRRNVLDFLYKEKNIKYRLTGDNSIRKLLGFGNNQFLNITSKGITENILPINLRLKHEYEFYCQDLKYHPICGQVLRYVPFKKSVNGRQIVKFKNLEYRKVDLNFLNNLNFNWSSDIKVYYFIIKARYYNKFA